MDACFRGQTNGLLGAGQPGMLFVLAGLHTGSVALTVDVVEREPQLDDQWEECIEVSFVPTATDVGLVDWDRQLVCQLPLQMRDYRVRYTARGMDRGNAADTITEDEQPVDSYGLWFWPASPAPDRILTQTSQIGIGTTGRKACEHLAPSDSVPAVTRFAVDRETLLRIAAGEIEVAAEHQLVAPTLVRSQALSALYQAARRGEITAEDGRT
jgi:hypothetical protein